jgi:dTDP-4-amino-4,6-dideoxygalactose transaminase
MSAAVGRVGLRKLPEWHERRTRNALRLAEGLADLPGLRIPLPLGDTTHAFYRLYGYVVPDALKSGWDRDTIAAAITAEGVPVRYGACAEIYREQAFITAGLSPATRLPVAAEVHETSMCYLVHPTVGDDEIDAAIRATRKVLEVASK